ncbi:hypothetical protein ACFPMF_01805 [Larkinella bovis]|uniref:Uncharacterized protein n=1 Tax=Larkinella bovis TaxID=683041 RepID=A0ABW0I3D4_9BACT
MEQLSNFISSPYGHVIVWLILVIVLTAFGSFVLGFVLGDRERKDRNAYLDRPDDYYRKHYKL